MARAARRTQISAGLLVYRRSAERVEVLLAHPGGPFWAKKDTGAWTIPKGLADCAADPDLLATAQREFTEETGFTAEGPFLPLRPVTQTSGKIVHAFACAGDFDPAELASNTFEIEWPPRSRRRASFPEVDRAEWFTIAQARQKILSGQLGFIDRLLELPDDGHQGA
jgi:predicted NUDIX family NTP pyrophosphohydrolase